MLGTISKRSFVFITIAALLAVQVAATFAAPVALAAISPVVTETGKISLSVDANGTNAASGTLRVLKSAGATVRKAFLAAASVPGFSAIVSGDIQLDGTAPTFTMTSASTFGAASVWGDVTSIVKSKIDAAPAGIVNFTVTENNTFGVDGEILAVILDDPTQLTDNTVVLFFGAQASSGDDFNILLAAPIDKTNPSLKLDFSLGISFGFQPSNQFSTVDVNSIRMTSCAGGQDDGAGQNGALITAGGIGDTDANPDPNCTGDDPLAPRQDDELYDLRPFVNNGDTTIKVHTSNPSNDDNIFFAALNLSATTAVVGEGIVLSPLTATNPVGTPHTVTATLQDSTGAPIVGKTVTFTVTAGPNMGVTGTAVTDSTGHASFTYTSTLTGTDTIQASFLNSLGMKVSSNTVTKIWTSPDTTGPTCTVTALIPGPPTQLQITVQDTGSGLASIVARTLVNATLSVPAFTVGTTSPVVVTATKIDQTTSAQVGLTVTDVAGNVTLCDPITTLLVRDIGRPEIQTFTGLDRADSKVTLYNAPNGVKMVETWVNGQKFKVTNLVDNQIVTIDVASAMHAGTNTIELRANGGKGSSVTVMIHD